MEKKMVSLMVDDTEKIEERIRPKKKLRMIQEQKELLRLFECAVTSHDWELAVSLIMSSSPKTLNDALCVTLDSIWLLSTQQQLSAILGLVEKIIANGAYDFTTAFCSASLLGFCVLGFRSQSTTTPAGVVTTGMTQRLDEFIQEDNGCVVWLISEKKDVSEVIQKLTNKCIGFNSSCCQGNNGHRVNNNSDVEMIQLQLSAFKSFLDLVHNQILSTAFSMAFNAACLLLTFLSTCFDYDCASGIWATSIPGLLAMLVEGGAANGLVADSCFSFACNLGSRELVRMLLKVAQMYNLDVDVDKAFEFASLGSKIGTMDFLVQEADATVSWFPLITAAARGSKEVVEWFVRRGCPGMKLYFTLMFATSYGQVDVVAYLLPQVPQSLLAEKSISILKDTSKLSGAVDCMINGVAFLLCSNFVGDPASTYAAADYIVRSDDNENVSAELRAFLQEHWSEEAYLDGIRQGQQHYINIVRILKRGQSPICFHLMPPDLRVAIAYLPLYKECVKTPGGCLVSQRLRGQLVEAVRRLGGGVLDGVGQCRELLAILERRLSQFLHHC